ncbi:NadS family protein [Achromobacter anxifer]|uniref:NadS family protein n=1 Tax=Achromobacter anxifer TaxID=1287737 RepID=UPI0023F7558C|nr:NadS family protein [Achromobacter anxifer]MDF8365858.1 NadS family protein [Achromobacter anxifer]
MDEQLFADLKTSLKEAAAIRKGQASPSRVTTLDPLDVKRVREQTKLSQAEFAAALHVSVRTLQNWEQKRRVPTGPAAALLKVVANAPEMALRALHR